jgi:hypothetical protein
MAGRANFQIWIHFLLAGALEFGDGRVQGRRRVESEAKVSSLDDKRLEMPSTESKRSSREVDGMLSETTP